MKAKKLMSCLAALAVVGGFVGCATAEDLPAHVTKSVARPGPAATPTPCTITDGACADISEHKAWLLEDDKVVYGPVPMLPGGAEGTGESSDGTATPTGTFTVTKKAKNYWSKEFDAPMPNSVFFYPGVAFHTGSLVKYSHGCIHLSAEAAEKVFDTLEVGDPVQVVP